MKLIFINRFFYPDHSATSQLLSDLAFALAQRGHEVCVITSRQRYDRPEAGLPAFEAVCGVTIHRVWTSRFGRTRLSGRALDALSFYLSAAWRLWRSIERDAVVVAKTDPPLLSLIVAPLSRIRGAKLVNWLQDLFPEVASALQVGLPERLSRLLQRWRNRSLAKAALNVVLSEAMRERLLAQDIANASLTVIPNWADAECLRPVAPRRNPLRRQWGLRDKFVVGYSGNMGRAHDFSTLLSAIERLRDETDIAFLLIGDGYYRSWLEREAGRRRLRERILFQPYQPRAALSDSLSAADVHLVSLRPELEGLIVPSKLYGIAAVARPVLFIGAADGDTAELIKRADCGFVIPPGAALDLADAIRKLKTCPERCAAMGQNARSRLAVDKAAAVAAWEAALQRVTGDDTDVGNHCPDLRRRSPRLGR